MNCPVCNGRSVGRVGMDQYYCWDCFLEYQMRGNHTKVYLVSEDGCLVDYEPAVMN